MAGIEIRKASARGVDGAGPDYSLEDQVGHLLRRAHQRHVALFQRIMGENDPTPTQFAVMARLYERDDLSQNELGRLTAMDPATIKGVVARLEERGLIERAPDPNDQRRIRLSLTDRGRRIVPDLVEKARAITAATLAPLSREEAERLVALLRRIS